ncbi:DgyrCDS971 [Dimorphilus gyrociliatus]|uniref:Aminopeptidase n=1 Tax=Dimorphilus gyrociliatus TaxID=2664684 RepID=A0A7I8V902_9ANNE|nr:DgyrCDS971 [Dimorphilus gyrociliatus]
MGAILFIVIAMLAAFLPRNCEELKSPVKATNSSQEDIIPSVSRRLPENIQPIHYDLQIDARLSDWTFNGLVTILVKVKKSTNRIILHSVNQTIKSVAVTGHKEATFTVDQTLQQLKIELNSKLETSKTYNLTIEYESVISSGLDGFYQSTFTDKGKKFRLATTQMEPNGARRAFPCFDEPAFKATFTISIIHDKKYTAISNMPGTTASLKHNREKTTFSKTVKMSTYLVAFVVFENFGFVQTTTGKHNNISVRVYAPSFEVNKTHFALNTTREIIKHYEKLFGIEFPLPKSDMIAIPDFSAGAMENWGLITYRRTAILYDEKTSSGRDKQWVSIVIAHELAHQWFGNLVTMKWWNDLWLNEGFASFVEFLGSDAVNPELRTLEQFYTETQSGALQADALANSHPIDVQVNDGAEIGELFDSISYNKGSSILYMLYTAMTPKKFKKGLGQYLKDFAYSNAETKDLWGKLENTTNIPVAKMMNTWVKKKGFPVVMVKKIGDRKLSLTQERFFVSQNERRKYKDDDYTWIIPITYKTNIDKGMQLMYPKKDFTINLQKGTEWYKVNVNQTGFYRVNYDDAGWNSIINLLERNHTSLNPSDRAGLISDSFELSRAGLEKISRFLNLTKYLKKEKSYVPWKIATLNLNYVTSMLKDNPEIYAALTNHTRELIKDTLKSLRSNSKTSEENHLKKSLNATLISTALAMGDNETIQEALDNYRKNRNSTSNIDSSIRGLVYSIYVKTGCRAEWEEIFDKFKKEKDPTEIRRLLLSLTDTKDAELLKKLLKMSIESKIIRKQDGYMVVKEILQTHAGHDLAWNFIKRNWKTIVKTWSDKAYSRIFKASASLKSNEYDLQEMKFFVQSILGNKPRPRAVKQSLEEVERNIEWKKRIKRELSELFLKL